uniref:G-protein coupled receptors family 3 profile domain-containing protein n=1 Tax=Latimeria chalumnae TaxID=7897 RepID=H3A187_LATCH
VRIHMLVMLGLSVLNSFIVCKLCKDPNEMCELRGNFNLPMLEKDADVIIGGLFPVHFRAAVPDLSYNHKPETSECEGFDFRAFRWVQTMIFTIEEINNNPTLLPNLTLGYKIVDTCDNTYLALQGAVTQVNGKEEVMSSGACDGIAGVPVIIGEAGSTQSITVARVVGPFRIPLISYFATCVCLSNKQEYPTFLRTVPSDLYQVRALAQLAKHFEWTWMGAIASDDDYGRYGIQLFTEQAKNNGVCIAFSATIPKVYSKQKIVDIVNELKKSTAKVIVVFTTEGEFYPLISEVVRQNITDKQWVASEAWITAALLSKTHLFGPLSGTIGFAIRSAEIPGLKEFLLKLKPSADPASSLVNMFWEELFHCKLQVSKTDANNRASLRNPCNGSEELEATSSIYTDVSQLRVSYNVYKAVYAVGHALHNLLSCSKGDQTSTNSNCEKPVQFQPWQLLQHLEEVRFQNQFGEEVHFDKNGDPVPSYDLINWQKDSRGEVQFVQVGHFDASSPLGQQLIIHEHKIVWSQGLTQVPESVCSKSCPAGYRKSVQEGEPICCFTCFPCAEGEISNETDSSECIKCPPDYWSNQEKSTCVPRHVEYLSYTDNMAIVLMAVAVLGACITTATAIIFYYHRNTPLVRANNSELSFLLLGSLLLCFLCSLTFLGQPSAWSCLTRHTAFGISFVLCISCLLTKTVVVLMAFKATLPGSSVIKWFGPLQQRAIIFLCTFIQVLICAIWVAVSPPKPLKNTMHQSAKIILQCDLGSDWAFYLMLGYIGLLSCICFVLAFLGRRLPNNFNEAKFITFSMLIFLIVWIAFIPAYVSSPGKYTVASEIFAILSSSFGMLLCIFAPKCYIILMKPEKNTKKGLMGK